MDFKVVNIGSKVVEDNFALSRPHGLITRYDFIHFLTEVTLVIDGVSKKYAPGACILYTPDFFQSYRHTTGWITHDYIEFECPDPFIFESLKFPLNKPFYTQISKSISEQIEKMRDINKSKTIFTQAELTTELYKLILMISKHLHSKQTSAYAFAKRENRDLLTKIRLDLYQNPGTLNVKRLAKRNGFTETHFCTIYKKIFQTTVHEDINKARFLYVQKSLEENVLPSQIANYLGFSSVEYFYMWFKKQTGKTVTKYLQEKQ